MSSEIRRTDQNNEIGLDDPDSSWERYIDLDDILNQYDTVIEIFDGERAIKPDSATLEQYDANYISLNDDIIQPGWEYNDHNPSIQQIRERLNGRSVILAFGFEGQNLPDYAELGDDLDSKGNWWDHPESLNADFIVDDETYTGALRPPKQAEINPYTLKTGDDIYDVLHISDRI